MKKAILITDPLSSAEYLVRRFKQLEYGVIALNTLNFQSDYTICSDSLYDKVIRSTGDLNEDIKSVDKLKNQYHIRHGFTGVEANFEYAETLLNQCFPHASNNVSSSHYRSDKFWMNEILRKNSMPSIKQQTVSCSLDLNDKYEKTRCFFYETNKKMVIKPKEGSAASVGVFSPKNEMQIHSYYAGNQEFLFHSGDYLLQEKIEGDEYFIDVSSYKGEHTVVSVGRYKKDLSDGTFAYQLVDNLDLESALAKEASVFVVSCLNALNMENGLSHSEVIMTDMGFRLIELNPRISGMNGFFNYMSLRKYNRDQISAYVDLINDRKIYSNIKHNTIYQRLYIFKNKKGTYNFFDPISIMAMPSYVEHKVLLESASSDTQNNNTLLGTVAIILLEHLDEQIIINDTDKIQSMELDGACLV